MVSWLLVSNVFEYEYLRKDPSTAVSNVLNYEYSKIGTRVVLESLILLVTS